MLARTVLVCRENGTCSSRERERCSERPSLACVVRERAGRQGGGARERPPLRPGLVPWWCGAESALGHYAPPATGGLHGPGGAGCLVLSQSGTQGRAHPTCTFVRSMSTQVRGLVPGSRRDQGVRPLSPFRRRARPGPQRSRGSRPPWGSDRDTHTNPGQQTTRGPRQPQEPDDPDPTGNHASNPDPQTPRAHPPQQISTVLARNKYRSHEEQVPFSRQTSTVLTSNKYRSRGE